MPSTVDTNPSMPFTPRLASTSGRHGARRSSRRRVRACSTRPPTTPRRAPRRRRREPPDPRTAPPNRRASSSIAPRADARRVRHPPPLLVDAVQSRRRPTSPSSSSASAHHAAADRVRGSSHAPSGSTSTWAMSAASHASWPCWSAARRRGPRRRGGAPPRTRVAQQRVVGRHRARAPRSPEIGSASTGQPAASAKRMSVAARPPRPIRRPRPAPVSATSARGRRACRRSGARTPGARAVHGRPSDRPGASTSGSPLGTSGSRNGRLRCTGPAGGPDAVADRARRELPPLGARAGAILGHAGIENQRTAPPYRFTWSMV